MVSSDTDSVQGSANVDDAALTQSLQQRTATRIAQLFYKRQADNEDQ
jgi:hypothetical protein